MNLSSQRAILAIDPAWTPDEPSGIALLVQEGTSWRCRTVAPSYRSFIALSCGTSVAWSDGRPSGEHPDVPELLRACERLLPEGVEIAVVPVDIPLATVPIAGRRAADQLISATFGARGCSAHSPGAQRPGQVGVTLRDGLAGGGFPLATAETAPGATGHVIEVYPHPALLSLLQRDYRVPYKVSHTGKYWRGASPAQRKANVLAELRAILAALQKEITGIVLPLPEEATWATFDGLKKYEDALDALVCAWCGIRFLAGRITAYGDGTAAIWVP
jgi:predicted RNase H-like nuclease